MSSDFAQIICGGIFGLVIYISLSWSFWRGAIKNELVLRGGVIKGKWAKIFGILGVLGVNAGAYLAISVAFKFDPPFGMIASISFILFILVTIALRLGLAITRLLQLVSGWRKK